MMGKKALWTTLVGKPPKTDREQDEAIYKLEARAYIKAAIRRGETCIVVDTIPELRDSYKYGYRVSNRLANVHHKRGRLGNLLRDQRHWMATSVQGHRWIHSNISEARKRGWICEHGLWNTIDE